MSFLAPLLPALIPAGIGLVQNLLGGNEKKKTEYENIQDPKEAAMRQKLLQMAMTQMGQPMGDFSGYGQGAASIFGIDPALPDWWKTGMQVPGGAPGGMPGGSPWSQLSRRQLQAPPGGSPPGVPAPGNPNSLPVR